MLENTWAPFPHGLTTKNRYLVRGGCAAARIDASPGLPIGPGGSPTWLRVLYGLGEASWETSSGFVQSFRA